MLGCWRRARPLLPFYFRANGEKTKYPALMWDLFFPHYCMACGLLAATPLCEACRDTQGGWFVSPPGITASWAAAPYDSGVGQALKKAKYAGDRAAIKLLAKLLAERAAPVFAEREIDVVVPVPASWQRRMVRGFNQSVLLAMAVSQSLDVPWVRALGRRAGGRRQAQLSAAERRLNVGDAVWNRHQVTGRVLLVDDVTTTGSTAAACAASLGITRPIELLCLCRAQRGRLARSQIWNDVQVLKRPAVSRSVPPR